MVIDDFFLYFYMFVYCIQDIFGIQAASPHVAIPPVPLPNSLTTALQATAWTVTVTFPCQTWGSRDLQGSSTALPLHHPMAVSTFFLNLHCEFCNYKVCVCTGFSNFIWAHLWKLVKGILEVLPTLTSLVQQYRLYVYTFFAPVFIH